MFTANHFKEWLSWQSVRAHLCSLVVTLSFNSTWRVPRDAARYGGLQYALALTAALVAVALPLALLQLAVGQLSQQDAVGLWRAVPLFKGIGYLRLLVSFLGSIYASVYLALTTAIFFYTLRNSIPFIECTEPNLPEDGFVNVFNATNCLDFTFMAPVKENPEYFIAMCFIIIFTWISLPFLFYSPVKLIKRAFYIFGPCVVILSISSVSGMGVGERIQWMVKREDWASFTEPHIWFAAVTQALLTSEVTGGYLVSAGDSFYSNNDVRWTSVVLIATSIIVNWLGLILWYSVSGGEMDTGAAAVLVRIYGVAAERELGVVWPLLAFAALFCSGIITMLVRLYPINERIRRAGGVRWRVACAGSALGCAGVAVGVLAGRWRALAVLEEYAVPMLIAIATVLEVLALVFIYGWKVLMEDIEFLTGDKLKKVWVWGWCAAPAVIVPLFTWWAVAAGGAGWQQPPPWPSAVLAATGALATLVLVAAGATAVARQVQYDIVGKLKSSLKPSRHWGPRDPITHYYWLARREEAQRGDPSGSRYRRRHLGQLSGTIISKPYLPVKYTNSNEQKKRSNSDDWIYTIYRKNYLQEIFPDYFAPKKCRSKSLDWDNVLSSQRQQTGVNSSVYVTPLESLGSVKDDSRTVISDKVKFSKF